MKNGYILFRSTLYRRKKLPFAFQGATGQGGRCLPSLPGHRPLLAPEQMELPVQSVQGKDIAAQRHHNGEFQAVLHDLVQDHIPVGHHQEGVLRQGDPAPAGGETLWARMGNGTQTAQGHGAEGRPLHFGGHDRGGRGIFHDRGLRQGPRNAEKRAWQQDKGQCHGNGGEHRSGRHRYGKGGAAMQVLQGQGPDGP